MVTLSVATVEEGPIDREALSARSARANFAAETIFIDLVIFSIDWTDFFRMSTGEERRGKTERRRGSVG